MKTAALAGLALVASAWVGQATAATQVFAGRLDDPGNPALVGSDLGAALFGTPGDVANNVALYNVVVAAAGPVSVVSTGFAAGGADPYFSLFLTTLGGDLFVDSNFVQAFSTGGDFSYAANLAAGNYRIALGVFANLSFAENLGTGTLADGFIGFGAPGSLGDSSYRLEVMTTTSVPEPSGAAMLALALLALGWRARAMPGRVVSPSNL